MLPDLGDDANDISVGNQPLTIGDGLVINGAVTNAFQRAAFYTSLRAAFQKTAILKLDPSELMPVRGTFFHLEDVSNHSLLKGLDQPKSKLLGGSIDWHGDPRPDKLGSVSFRALELGKLRPSSPALKLLPGQRGQSRFSAYAAIAAPQREHVGAYGIGIVEGFAVSHCRGSSVPQIQHSSVQASVDIDP